MPNPRVTQTQQQSLQPRAVATDQPPVSIAVRGVMLEFFLRVNAEQTLATVMVRKPGNLAEEYPVFSITSRGECFRYPGLPVGWGFRLTRDRRIKEVR